MTEIQHLFIRNVRRTRAELGLSQAALAERCGLSANYVAELESGRRFPSHETLAALCRGLELRPYELFIDPDVDCVVLKAQTEGSLLKDYIRKRLVELITELD